MLKRIQLKENYFWLSLISHVLFFLFFYLFNSKFFWLPIPDKEKNYYYYVPAYVQPSSSAMSASLKASQKIEHQKINSLALEKAFDFSQTSQWFSPASFPSLLNSASKKQHESPVRLIGEKFLDHPLLKLLGRAITTHLYYPSIARELNKRGVVTIALILQPSGEITSAHIIKSSREHLLDAAALNAINASSPIAGVDLYVKEPKRLVINIIF